MSFFFKLLLSSNQKQAIRQFKEIVYRHNKWLHQEAFSHQLNFYIQKVPEGEEDE